MVLVPEGMLNTIQQYQQQQITPETKNLVRLDNQMETILKDESRPTDEKARQFSQHLQRYLTMYDKTKTPNQIVEQPMVTDSEQETLSPIITHAEQDILETVPPSFKTRAQNLLKKLKSHPDEVSWDSKSQLILNGKTLPGTNIVDLVNDAIRPRKNFTPRGYEEFVQGLAQINTPEDLVKNDARRRLLLEYRDNPRESPREETPFNIAFIPTPPSTDTPPARRRRLPVLSGKKQSPLNTRPSSWIRY